MQIVGSFFGILISLYIVYMGFGFFSSIASDRREAASYKERLDSGDSDGSDEYFYKRAKQRADYAPIWGIACIVAGATGALASGAGFIINIGQF